MGMLDESARDFIKKIQKNAELIKSPTTDKLNFSKQIYGAAITDFLTGLKNRRYFNEEIKPNLERISNLSYLMIDIDHFKQYNDRFYHQQGDRALIAVVKVITKISKKDITIRYGGEEFSVILVGYEDPHGQVHKHAENIRGGVEKRIIIPFSNKAIINHFFNETGCIEEPISNVEKSMYNFFKDKKVNNSNYIEKLNEYFSIFERGMYNQLKSYITALQRVTVSIGGATRTDNEPIEELIDRADEAIYKAKKTRNMVVIAK